jgi:hypothetical protein
MGDLACDVGGMPAGNGSAGRFDDVVVALLPTLDAARTLVERFRWFLVSVVAASVGKD